MKLPWLSRKPDPLLERAEALVDTANSMGVVSYTQFAADLPIVNNINTEQWDWVFTIAGVFLADMRLCTGDLEPSRKQKLRDILFKNLTAWKPDGIAGLHDCNTVYKRTYERLSAMEEYKSDRRFLGSDSLGTWMTGNLLEPVSKPPFCYGERYRTACVVLATRKILNVFQRIRLQFFGACGHAFGPVSFPSRQREVLKQVLGHWPQSEEERKLVRMTGAFVSQMFFDWWETT